MAFDPVERLREGNVEFIFSNRFPTGDFEYLVNRIRELPDKVEVMKAFIPKIIKHNGPFCFNLIYDVEEFRDDARKILSKYRKRILFDSIKMENILYKTSWGENYVYYNLDKVLSDYELNKIDVLVKFIFEDAKSKRKWINKFIRNDDMHKRFLFLITVIRMYPSEANEILVDFKSIVEDGIEKDGQFKLFPDRICSKDLSQIVYTSLHSNINKDIYKTMKKYLIENYKENDLAEYLLDPFERENKDINVEEFRVDANDLLLTSRIYTYQILKNYTSYISKEIIDRYKNVLALANDNNYKATLHKNAIENIYSYELGPKLEKILDKYLSLSSAINIQYLDGGGKSCCFKIGDYVLKMGNGKYSKSEVICPSLYLIIKNLEEYYIRNSERKVICSMEVQPYLKKSGENLPGKVYRRFIEDLRIQGYFTTDPTTLGSTGKNFRILNSYKDADCENPELLPDYFKELPMVLCDRDIVYKNDTDEEVIRFNSY